MRLVRPYHAGARIQRGKGFGQRGAGLGSLFATLFRSLKPLASKGFQMAKTAAKTALKNPEIKSAVDDIKKSAIKSGTEAVKDLQTSAIKSGVTAINKVLNTEEKKTNTTKKRKPKEDPPVPKKKKKKLPRKKFKIPGRIF